MTRMGRIGVMPGTFDPPTVAHLAIAHAAHQQRQLSRVDLVLTRAPLGKRATRVSALEHRVAVLREIVATRSWLAVRITDDQLIADVATGYDVVIVGADKWQQMRDVEWYRSSTERDRALARLPEVAVAPRGRIEVAEELQLEIPPEHHDVSSTRARHGETDLMAEEARSYGRETGLWLSS